MTKEEFIKQYPNCVGNIAIDTCMYFYNEGRREGLAEINKLKSKLLEYEEENKNLHKQLNEGIQAIAQEHNALVSSPTALASNLAGLGFKGTIVREQPLYNTLVTDHDTVGTYTETIKIG